MQSQQARVRARAAIRLRGPVCTAIGQFLNNVYARPSARPSDAPGFWFLEGCRNSPAPYLPAPAAPPSNHQPRTGTTREHHARCDGAKGPCSLPSWACVPFDPIVLRMSPHPTPAPSSCAQCTSPTSSSRPVSLHHIPPLSALARIWFSTSLRLLLVTQAGAPAGHARRAPDGAPGRPGPRPSRFPAVSWQYSLRRIARPCSRLNGRHITHHELCV